ncbi:MAG: chromate resistance protein [Sterolibacteriaceae bacterium MAG5]|nr:chromate resistance protein [Candidatus Nitricoxidireducens bremensis]
MNHPVSWRLLVASLPTKPAAARMRLWRGARALGCAALRDGAWLLPAAVADAALAALAAEAVAAGGSAEVLAVAADAGQDARFRALFDHAEEYGRLLAAVQAALAQAPDPKAAHGLRRDFKALAAIDFFPGAARAQVEAALAELAAHAGGEPRAGAGALRRLDRADYQGRTWATRKHLWVDRMASAWLIRRFIDRKAQFLWLDDPQRCPRRALGFDFDGAAFSHLGNRVSFEVLAASFGLDADPALARIGALVHVLDVGGVPVAEAAGIEAVLAGARERCADDDKLLAEAGRVFDSLYAAYTRTPDHD